jgi:hypothetical protein
LDLGHFQEGIDFGVDADKVFVPSEIVDTFTGAAIAHRSKNSQGEDKSIVGKQERESGLTRRAGEEKPETGRDIGKGKESGQKYFELFSKSPLSFGEG